VDSVWSTGVVQDGLYDFASHIGLDVQLLHCHLAHCWKAQHAKCFAYRNRNLKIISPCISLNLHSIENASYSRRC